MVIGAQVHCPQLLDHEQRLHDFHAPPCHIWDAMQSRDEEYLSKRCMMRHYSLNYSMVKPSSARST